MKEFMSDFNLQHLQKTIFSTILSSPFVKGASKAALH